MIKMLLTKEVEVSISSANKTHFINLGYIIPTYINKSYKEVVKRNTKIIVKVEDLCEGSSAIVKILCDYCLEKGISTIIERAYSEYINRNKKEIIHKDCCINCIQEKIKESNIKKYGVPHIMNVKEFVENRKTITGEYVIDEFKKANCTPIFKAEEFKNSRQPLPYLCNNHIEKGVQYKCFDTLRYHKLCYYCNIDRLIKFNSNAKFENKNWKKFYTYFRDTLTNWKKESMENSNFKCVITGERFDDIHHLYSFDLIFKQANDELGFYDKNKPSDYTEEEVILLKEKIIELHKIIGLGICLKKEIHQLFHCKYGYKSNTPEQFEEFKQDLKFGKYNRYLQKHNLKIII